MSYLKKLFNENSSAQVNKIQDFISNPNDLDVEIMELQNLLDSEAFEKALAVFLIEILSKCIKKQDQFTRFIQIILSHIEKTISYKNSILHLRFIKAIINTKFFIPVAYYLIKIMSLAQSVEKLVCSKKRFSYDDFRLSNDVLNLEELQTFVVSECIEMIKLNCHLLGNNIGYPEYAFVVCNELRSKCKIRGFRELVSELIKELNDRKEFVEEKRSKLSAKLLDGKVIAEFESNLSNW